MPELAGPVAYLCAHCKGEGEYKLLIHGHSWQVQICRECGGQGMMTAEQWERRQQGRRLRADRLRRNMSLRREAELLGISIKQLSDKEWGR